MTKTPDRIETSGPARSAAHGTPSASRNASGNGSVPNCEALSNQARITGTIVPTRVDSEVAKAQEAYRGPAFELDIQRVESMRLLSFRWHPGAVDPKIDYSKEPTTLVELKLDDVPDGARLTIVESGFEQLPTERRAAAYADNAGGWQVPLKLIAKYLAQST